MRLIALAISSGYSHGKTLVDILTNQKFSQAAIWLSPFANLTIFSSPLPWNVLKYIVNNMDEFVVVIPEIERKKR
jgi:hypothetical protein